MSKNEDAFYLCEHKGFHFFGVPSFIGKMPAGADIHYGDTVEPKNLTKTANLVPLNNWKDVEQNLDKINTMEISTISREKHIAEIAKLREIIKIKINLKDGII